MSGNDVDKLASALLRYSRLPVNPNPCKSSVNSIPLTVTRDGVIRRVSSDQPLAAIKSFLRWLLDTCDMSRVDLFDKMSSSFGSRHILEFPDEILTEILLYLNTRERGALGHICERFNRLLSRDKKLWRNLDFSNEGRLTSALDIQRYFNDESMNVHILKVDLRNVKCMDPAMEMLADCFSRALNLVDINIHGIKLTEFELLGESLAPLVHLRRLSMDWPVPESEDSEHGSSHYKDHLQEPFSRLTYLSMETWSFDCAFEFSMEVYHCTELKELRWIQGSAHPNGRYYDELIMRDCASPLSKLEILEFYMRLGGCCHKWQLASLLPAPENWMEFKPFSDVDCYFAKDVEVCKELRDTIDIILEPSPSPWPFLLLRFEYLLKAVIRITHEKVPEKFCSSVFDGEERCKLKIEDTKLLLKDPRHQIDYLHLSQSIGTDCDVHLFALAGPNLTELNLSHVMKVKKSSSKQTDSQEQSHFETSPADSSFRMLVENTPLVRDLTLNSFHWHPRYIWQSENVTLEDDEVWDLGPLSLICHWKNLKSLRLLHLPISDGKFLIEIGKQCEFLEKLELHELGPSAACCYTKELSLMLKHCQNLADFSMSARNIGTVSDVFVSLAGSTHLKRVRLRSTGEGNDTANLVSSVEQLLRRCSKLTTFLCIMDAMSQADYDQLTPVLRRMRTELHRPSLQFQVVCDSNSESPSTMDTVCEDSPTPFFPYTNDNTSYV